MVLVSRVRIALGSLLLGLPLLAGCGESIETGPTVEPGVGPGVAAGGGTSEKAPTFGPAPKADKKAAPDKPAEKK